MINGYIYKITCLVNNKIYIGQTTRDITIRFKEHIRDSTHFDYPLYRAMQKYGTNNFIIELIETCQADELNIREQYWIQYFDSVAWHNKGYNGTIGGDGCFRKSIQLDPQIIQYYINQKYDISQIAEILGCGHNTIRNVAHENNIFIPNHPHQSKTVKMINIVTKEEHIFYSVYEGALWIINHNYSQSTNLAGVQSNICKCCKGLRKTAYKHQWEYI